MIVNIYSAFLNLEFFRIGFYLSFAILLFVISLLGFF